MVAPRQLVLNELIQGIIRANSNLDWFLRLQAPQRGHPMSPWITESKETILEVISQFIWLKKWVSYVYQSTLLLTPTFHLVITGGKKVRQINKKIKTICIYRRKNKHICAYPSRSLIIETLVSWVQLSRSIKNNFWTLGHTPKKTSLAG